MITPTLPAFPADNAGAVYVFRVAKYLATNNDFTALVVDGPGARRASTLGQVVNHHFFGGTRAARRHQIFETVRRIIFPATMARRMQHSLFRNPDLEAIIRGADVIDLQWAETGSLVRRIRRINPDAKVICTWHDVLSQRFMRARQASNGTIKKLRWSWAIGVARVFERRILQEADALVVLSEKDAALVNSGAAEVMVVEPPLATEALAKTDRHPGPANILFVANLARWENEQGLSWFLDEVLPKIRQQHPSVTVKVAGTGILPHVQAAADRADIHLLGFVADLAPLYAEATLVVVPLHLGAGVKFKVVEALLAGVPVVTTPVGAEGIGHADWYAAVDHEPGGFAAGVNRVLADPRSAEAKAGRVRVEAAGIYGAQKFKARMDNVYGTSKAWASEVVCSTTRGNAPLAATVVIPVFNGAQTIDKQLAALAAQTGNCSFEVVVSDNGSTDRTRAVVQEWKDKFASFKIVDASRVRGAAFARNEGARHATSGKILFCDADDLVRAGWVNELVDALDDHHFVGGAVQKVSVVGGAFEKESSDADASPRSVHGFLPYALTCNCAVRREALVNVGGFDSSYKAGHEEADFGWRLQLAGYRMKWLSGTVIDYVQRTTALGLLKQNFYYAKSAILLWTRFSDEHRLAPVSFKGGVQNFAAQLMRIGLMSSSATRKPYAKALGWAAGTVAGHLEYRILRRAPRRQLMVGSA
nr:glycosyltransferase [Pseudarthrobacter sp. W1I19]